MLRVAYFSFLLALASLPLAFFGDSWLRWTSLAFILLTIALTSVAVARRE